MLCCIIKRNQANLFFFAENVLCRNITYLISTWRPDCVCVVIDSVVISSVVSWVSRSNQVKPKTIKLVLATCHLRYMTRSKSKDCLTQNQDNVSKWSDIFTHGLLFQSASTVKIQLSLLVEYKADIIIVSSIKM